jgi:hypothetical protein
MTDQAKEKLKWEIVTAMSQWIDSRDGICKENIVELRM